MKPIKLLVADVDGTLVGMSKMLGPHTRNALEVLHAHGVKLGIASGRQVDTHMFTRNQDWGLSFQFDVFIGMNGGELYDESNGINEHYSFLSREALKDILEMMEPLDLNPFIYDGDSMLCRRIDPDMKASAARNRANLKIAKDNSDFYATEHAKIMFRMPECRMDGVRAYAATHPSDLYHCFRTQTTMLEFMSKGIDKGTTLKKYCEKVGIPIENVWACGDLDNDNSMIEIAGTGVCLQDGAEGTKAVANYVTEYSSEEDGLGRFLEKHLLKELGWL